MIARISPPQVEPSQQIALAEDIMKKELTTPETRDRVRELLGKALEWRAQAD